jgi:hypothetical protein
MLYVNQNDYMDMAYPEKGIDENSPEYGRTVAAAGCGLCSLVMLVDQLSLASLSVEECRDMALDLGASVSYGTDMKILGRAVAEKFDLTYEESSDIEKVAYCLKEGGRVIMYCGGSYEGHIGVFTETGHYILVIGVRDGEYCILDPSLSDTKFDKEGRVGKVRREGNLCYISAELMAAETANRDPGYFLFHRKDDCDIEK